MSTAESEQHTLRGIRAVEISATAPALVLASFRGPPERAAGKIVVARHATPEAVLVMEHAAGLVFETGGPASHAAILARELGVACLVGVAGARELIRDGDLLHIDGRTGEVHVRRA